MAYSCSKYMTLMITSEDHQELIDYGKLYTLFFRYPIQVMKLLQISSPPEWEIRCIYD